MSVAVAQVKQIITIQGVDNASATVAKAQASLKGMGSSASHVAEKAGDIERGVRGFKDILGETASKEMQDLSDKFGGVEAIIKGFGPKLGVVGLAVAGVAAGAAYLWQKAEEARKKQLETAAELATTELDRAKADQSLLASRYGVTAELLGVEREIDGVKRAQQDAARVVNGLVDKERDLIKATKEERDKDAETLRGQITAAKELLGVQQQALDAAKQAAVARERDAGFAARVAFDNDRALEMQQLGDSLLDRRESLTYRTAANEFRIRDATAEVAKLRAEAYSVEGVEKLKAAIEKLLGLERNQRSLAAEGEALLNERRAKGREDAERRVAAAAAATDAALRRLRAEFAADGAETEKERLVIIEVEAAKERQAIESSKAAAVTKAQLLQALDQETANKRRALAAELGAAEAAVAEETRKLLETQAARAVAISQQVAAAQTANAKTATVSMAQRLREIGQVDAAILVERRQAHADYASEVAKIDREIAASAENVNAQSEEFADLQLLREQRVLAAKQTLAEQQRRLDNETQARFREGIALSAEAVKAPAALIGRLGEENQKLAQGLNTAADAIANVSRQWKGLKESAPDAISAAGAVASAFVEDERDKAAILAVTELAASIASYANQDYVGAAAHAASAALYAGVAGGVIGGGSKSAGGAPAAGPGGFAASPSPTGGQPAVQTRAPSVVVNFNQPLVTKQEVGKALTGALRSVGSTGYAKAKGV